jgi:hypothetical protein
MEPAALDGAGNEHDVEGSASPQNQRNRDEVIGGTSALMEPAALDGAGNDHDVEGDGNDGVGNRVFSRSYFLENPDGKKQQHPARACFDFDFDFADFELFRGSARWVHCYGP